MKKNMCKIILCIIIAIVVVVIRYGVKTKTSKNEIDVMAEKESDSSNSDSNNNESKNQSTQDVQNMKNYNDDTKNGAKEEKNEIFSDYYDKAEALLGTMTMEEKVGQMFFARYPGKNNAINEIQSGNPGGYILFGVDFNNKSKQQVIDELAKAQSSSKVKLILGVDEEGGTVTRVSKYSNFRFSKFESPQEVLKSGGLQALLEDSQEKSELLKSIGLNMNLCPVVDIPTNTSSFIYARSFGKDAKETANYTSELIKQMNNDNIIATMKHFPGYGDNVDTHTGIAIDKRDYSVFEQNDFLPFNAGIKQKCPTILVNHNIINCMDKDNPASLSANVHKILREELGFSGLIITDDLAMNAVKKYVDEGNAAVQAILAGNDMIISSNFKAQKREVLQAVYSGKIPEETINKAVRRILACKYYYGIIE